MSLIKLKCLLDDLKGNLFKNFIKYSGFLNICDTEISNMHLICKIKNLFPFIKTLAYLLAP